MERIATQLAALRYRLPRETWEALCSSLEAAEAHQGSADVLQALAFKLSPDHQLELKRVLEDLRTSHSWQEIAFGFRLLGALHRAPSPELLWTGPELPTPVRRIDQVLYDLINSAQERILLVTFAASHIGHLNRVLENALKRGVEVRLVLEFEEASGGQLSFDALRAFSLRVKDRALIYYWPKNARNQSSSGRTGKLHAKCAVVDDRVLISSANLTDDAFNRNMELGMLSEGELAHRVWEHFSELSEKVLKLKL